MFHNITCKIGNMRKAARFVIYPISEPNPASVLIQSDKRIAQVELATGKTVLSDGKGGHQGAVKLSPALGSTVVQLDAATLAELQAEVAKMKTGPATLIGA